jgi:hypothetical protein
MLFITSQRVKNGDPKALVVKYERAGKCIQLEGGRPEKFKISLAPQVNRTSWNIPTSDASTRAVETADDSAESIGSAM